MEITITEVKGTRIGEYEPGNGTRYTAVAVPWASDKMMGAMGIVDQGWLVVCGNTARAYLLQKDGLLIDSYIQEHFGGLPGDYPYLGDLIRALVKRTGSSRSDYTYRFVLSQGDDDMPEDREAYYNERAEAMP